MHATEINKNKLEPLFSTKFTIICGCQTEIGQAAFEACTDYKKFVKDFFHLKSYCDKKRTWEGEDIIPEEYPLEEKACSVDEIIEHSVTSTNATLIIYTSTSIHDNYITKKAQEVIKHCFIMQQKCIIQQKFFLGGNEDANWIVDWIIKNKIASLNIIGSMGRHNPSYLPKSGDKGVFRTKTYNLINEVLEKIVNLKGEKDLYQTTTETSPSKEINEFTDYQTNLANVYSNLLQIWKNLDFTLEQTQNWINIGLQPSEAPLAAWLRDFKHLSSEEVLNHGNYEQLKQEFLVYQEQAAQQETLPLNRD